MSVTKVISTALSVVVLIVAFWYSRENGNRILEERLRQVLDAMLEVEEQHVVGEVRIAVGYGACKDIFVRGADVFGAMAPPKKTAHYNSIESLKNLKELYALFYAAGSAAERYVGNDTLFNELVGAAEAVPSSYSALGGNAPVMASRFAIEGARVLLAAKRSPYVLKHIHPGVEVGGGQGDMEDDIHLIFEYKTGEKWGKYEAPRANRFIIHSDNDNPTVSSLEEFGMELKSFKPNLLVVGGLQMMDNFPFPPGVRKERLKAVRDQMVLMPTTTRIHFEMASFTETELLKDLSQYIIPYADSLGMNEQELPNLYSILKYGNVSFISDFNPRVAVVLDQMREVFRLLDMLPETAGHRQVTRLHLHTLAFQAIMVRKGSPWKNNLAAATKAALTANRHVCGNSEISIENAKMLMDDGFTLSEAAGAGRIMFDSQHPVSCWNEDGGKIEICIAPVLVCTAVRHTAGGGDNISAAGLVLQV
ncbi:ADP-dependent glucokinase-like [Macrobrachium nipponense]|uniref:ADP-dependent glucokinase-like n=1 Tax=Macrobrachium nipponense TaxID=159736 RepID=UPI0030C89DD0